jgi:hypothetical protein
MLGEVRVTDLRIQLLDGWLCKVRCSRHVLKNDDAFVRNGASRSEALAVCNVFTQNCHATQYSRLDVCQEERLEFGHTVRGIRLGFRGWAFTCCMLHDVTFSGRSPARDAVAVSKDTLPAPSVAAITPACIESFNAATRSTSIVWMFCGAQVWTCSQI